MGWARGAGAWCGPRRVTHDEATVEVADDLIDNGTVPAYWSAARIANQIHRQVLAAHGFTCQGRECERRVGGLRKSLTVYTRANLVTPQVQLVSVVAVDGLPVPVTRHRCDSLGGIAETPAGRNYYLLPSSADPLPPDLLADVAGPILALLSAADGLAEFVLWAQEVFVGQEHPAWWGRYQPVQPQGTGPLQAAAFAAAQLRDPELVEYLTSRVENEERGEQYFDDFLTEIRQFYPQLRHRHPMIRPARW